ncbi:MAG TPA: hypothetical protein VKA63_09495 [Candidatus Krumholzibacteria bacterium]|nr:hypothetical protein [Candidatus Krumholzibacteria bacterium]
MLGRGSHAAKMVNGRPVIKGQVETVLFFTAAACHTAPLREL